MKTITLTRKELYDKVWSIPMTSLAKEYNLSDNGLRKICKKHSIPLPPVGYWQKLQYDKKVYKTPLPKLRDDVVVEINIPNYKRPIYNENIEVNLILQERIYSNKTLVLNVPERLSNPDEITIQTKNNLEKNKGHTYLTQIQGAIRTDRGLPRIVVTPKNVSRSLRLLDTLIKNFKKLDYELELQSDGLFVCYKGAKLSMSIREKASIVYVESKYDWDRRRLNHNGKLALKLSLWGDSEFVDKETNPLEKQIEKILGTVEAKFQELFQIWAERERKEKIAEEQRLIKLAIQKRKDDELLKFKEFNKNAHRWHNYLLLKEYYEEVINNHSADDEWIEWAKNKLNWYNPFINKEDELLSESDKDKLQ